MKRANVENSNREEFSLLFISGNLFFCLLLLILERMKGSWRGNEDLSEIDNDTDENVAPYVEMLTL